MAKYKGVTRLITIYITKGPSQRYAIDLAPDPAEIIVGDTVQWQVQNAPTGVKVTVDNFRRINPAPDIQLRREKTPVMKPKIIHPAGPSRMKIKARWADVGFYKYDILFDGEVVMDPETEVRGPRGY